MQSNEYNMANTRPPPEAAEAGNTAPTTPPAKTAKRTPGDNTFDWLTYGLVGGVGNFLLSIVAGYWARYGSGSKQIGKLSKSMQNAGMSHASAEDAIMATALGLGGTALIVPIKMLENNRAEIVNGINKNVGCETTIAEQKAEKTDQSWGGLIKSRLIAWGIVFGSFKTAANVLGPENFERFEHDFARNMVCKPLGKPTHIGGQESKLYKYGRIGALDIFATAASATILYVASRFLANKGEEEKTEAKATSYTAAPANAELGEGNEKDCPTCQPHGKVARTYHSQAERILQQKQQAGKSPSMTMAP